MLHMKILPGYLSFTILLLVTLFVATGMTDSRGRLHRDGEKVDTRYRSSILLPLSYFPDSLDAIARMELPAEQAFKNVRVLKGLKAREFMGAMEFMESALGVGCNYCHVQGNFASDEKPQKETARSMMRMVNEINARIFSAPTVTCNTCHHGHPHPDAAPSVHQKEWRGVDMANEADIAPDSTATLEGVLDRYTTALGGRSALEKISARTMKLMRKEERMGGKEGGEGRGSVMILYQTAEGWYFSRMPLSDPRRGDGGTELLQGYDGAIAWAKNGNKPSNPVFNEGLAVMMRMGELFPASGLTKNSTGVKLLGRITVGDGEYYCVAATARDGSSDRLYFNATTGLLARRYVKSPTPLGELPFAVEFDDYRPIDGVMIPHVMRWFAPRESWTDTVREVHQNIPVDPSMFRMP